MPYTGIDERKTVSANKVTTVSNIASQITDGMTVGIGGWGGRRKPMAVVRELLRSSVKDLTVVAYGGMDVSLLAAAGKIKCLVYGFVSHDVIPMDQAFRQARQSGAFEFREIDEGMLQWGLRAAAMGLPFLPTRAGIGTDVETLNPWIKTVRSPYNDGELLMAMPALNLDVAIVHVNEADALGHTAILGPDPFFDDMFCRAAKKSYATCERLVETESFNDSMKARLMPIERSLITGVAEVPLGAHPTSCGPDYGIDVKHIGAYTKRCAAKEWDAHHDEFLTQDTHDAYVAAVGGAEHIRALPLPVF